MQESWIPLLISAAELDVLIFGGGRTALRKALNFRGSAITVVSETILPDLERLASRIIQREISDDEDGLIKEHDLVIIATDDHDLNERIRERTQSLGRWSNSVEGGGDVLIPSLLRRPGFTVSVSTEGRIPVYPPFLIDVIDEHLDGRYDLMAELLTVLRSKAREVIPKQSSRAAFLESILEDREYWELLSEGDLEAALNRGLEAMRS